MIQNVFIAGAGQMGQGIAQVIISAGLNVHLFDVNDQALRTAIENIQWSLEKLHSKKRLAEPVTDILTRLQITTDLTASQQAELVIEAAPEQEALKRRLFSQLDQLLPPDVMIASNTSAIPIATLASATKRPHLVCGLHFFNPVPLMPLVEIFLTPECSQTTSDLASQFVERIGKHPVYVKGDQAGFIVNRILGAAMIEAMRILESGQASAADIDKAMRLGCGWKMGPLETADLAGLDIVMNMCDVMQTQNKDTVFSPPAILRRHVDLGLLGRKSGTGFFKYPELKKT